MTVPSRWANMKAAVVGGTTSYSGPRARDFARPASLDGRNFITAKRLPTATDEVVGQEADQAQVGIPLRDQVSRNY